MVKTKTGKNIPTAKDYTKGIASVQKQIREGKITAAQGQKAIAAYISAIKQAYKTNTTAGKNENSNSTNDNDAAVKQAEAAAKKKAAAAKRRAEWRKANFDPDVKKIQQEMFDAGIITDKAEIDGLMGPKTEAAMTKYNKFRTAEHDKIMKGYKTKAEYEKKQAKQKADIGKFVTAAMTGNTANMVAPDEPVDMSTVNMAKGMMNEPAIQSTSLNPNQPQIIPSGEMDMQSIMTENQYGFGNAMGAINGAVGMGSQLMDSFSRLKEAKNAEGRLNTSNYTPINLAEEEGIQNNAIPRIINSDNIHQGFAFGNSPTDPPATVNGVTATNDDTTYDPYAANTTRGQEVYDDDPNAQPPQGELYEVNTTRPAPTEEYSDGKNSNPTLSNAISVSGISPAKLGIDRNAFRAMTPEQQLKTYNEALAAAGYAFGNNRPSVGGTDFFVEASAKGASKFYNGNTDNQLYNLATDKSISLGTGLNDKDAFGNFIVDGKLVSPLEYYNQNKISINTNSNNNKTTRTTGNNGSNTTTPTSKTTSNTNITDDPKKGFDSKRAMGAGIVAAGGIASLYDNWQNKKIAEKRFNTLLPEQHLLDNIRLAKGYDTTATEAAMNNQVRDYTKAVAENTTNSANALNKIRQAGGEAAGKVGQARTLAYNKETEAINNERGFNAGINEKNALKLDDAAMNDYNRKLQLLSDQSANAANMQDDFTQFGQNAQALRYQNELLDLEHEKYKDGSQADINTDSSRVKNEADFRQKWANASWWEKKNLLKIAEANGWKV